MLRAALPCLVATLAACGPARFASVGPKSTDATTRIERVELRWSNVYLLRHGDAFGLVDTGSPVDREKLYDALVHAGVHPRELRVVILTHGHADHAGLARLLQLYGAKIVLGAGDVDVAADGENKPLRPTSLLASAIAPMFMFPFEPFSPDLAVDGEIDLAAYGFPDVRVVQMPGHTPGSVVVKVGAHEALVGDMIVGGWFGGAVYRHSAGEHYYQADKRANHANVGALLAAGVQRFYVGHGGPLERATVVSWLRGVDKKLVPAEPGAAPAVPPPATAGAPR
jgi:hydroxyacylglutathione hydrolase